MSDLVERLQRRIAYGGKKGARARRRLAALVRRSTGRRPVVTHFTIGTWCANRVECLDFFRGSRKLDVYRWETHRRRRNGLRS